MVAPYNAQVAEIQAALERRIGRRGNVGTVDKFQGREGVVAIYSMASSSREDAPRDMSFLYSRNRLNVAISRAQCLALLVASPTLLEAGCRTPEQMRMVDALCRFVEVAELDRQPARSEPRRQLGGDQLAADPRREHARAVLDLGDRDVLVGAVRDPDVARAEDDARRPADVDEHLHVGAVRLAEERRAASGHVLDDVGQARPAADGPTARAPSRTGRR